MSNQSGLPQKPKSVFTEWLEKLQQESWQLELLISGLALFGIWESRTGLLKFEYYLDTNVVDPYTFYTDAFVFVLWSGWSIFLINLLAHIIIRGLWIGAIGLRYVSGDIDYEELNYSDQFVNYFKKKIGSFDDYIERLEKLSSVLFSFTFLLFFLFFSFVFINIVFGILVSIGTNFFYPDQTGPNAFAIIFGSAFYGFGLLVIIDFFTIGGFKKVKDPTFSKIYLALYRFYSTLSLSFIYRPLLLNFIDNRYTRRLFYLAIPYTATLILGVSMLQLEKYAYIPSFHGDNKYFDYANKYSINWNNYDDLRTEHHGTYSFMDRPEISSAIHTASLNKYELDNSYGSVFLRYARRDNDLLARQHPDMVPFKEEGLRHRFFSSGKVENPRLEELITDQLRETRVMLNVVRNEMEKIDSADAVQFREVIQEFQGYSRDDIPDLRRSIEQKYEARKKEHADRKIKESLDALLANYRIYIDDISYTDSLDCSYFTHPNRHEQGVLCYFPVSHLEPGAHLMVVYKKNGINDCIDDCPEIEKFLPFRKI